MSNVNIFLLPQVIDQTAVRLPDRPAFRFEQQTITYAEIAGRSNSLAHLLVDQGVQRGDRVGIYLHKRMESAVALYGIMKAGAAYVPLDPAMPLSRLEFVLRDCGIRHVISQQAKLTSLQQVAASVPDLQCVIGPAAVTQSSVRLIPWAEVYQFPGHHAPHIPGLMEQDLAYIMYTSGSTGTPKGIMHTHYSGLSYARAAAYQYDVRPHDILSNHSPLHFDMSTFDFFSGPLAGATTIIIPEEYKMLPASLSELIQDERMTIWYSVTTALVELLLRGNLAERDLSSLRWVLFGGEPFPPGHLTALMELLPQARFGNVYGPAEVNQCTYFTVPPLPNQYQTDYVSIGQVWEIADWLIVDEQDNEVAPGEVGTLLICAPTRMQGYWNRPDLTEKGFYRQRPFPNAPFEKIFYRTGDLVQLGEDGELKFLGRRDRQVKIRGYRVELDEIEAAISTHEAVAETAVYPLSDSHGGLKLEAAVVVRQGMEILAEELKRHVTALLPAYAVPDTFAIHDRFPRTGSGKIDRRALQAVAQSNGDQPGEQDEYTK
jgi:amino acid adenylation domain-containing protein